MYYAPACMALASTCFILSLARTSVADTLLLMSAGPYVTGLFGWLLAGERVPLRTGLSTGVALAGAAVMVLDSKRMFRHVAAGCGAFIACRGLRRSE
jgi:drug/metabolite transporter (DMT)-like permease